MIQPSAPTAVVIAVSLRPKDKNVNTKIERTDANVTEVVKWGLCFPLIVGIKAKFKIQPPVVKTKSCHCIF